MAGMALAWLLADPRVTQIVVGPNRAEHLEPVREALERPLSAGAARGARAVLILGHDDVLAALSPQDCAEAMAEILAAHARGEAQMPLRFVVPFEGAAGFMGLMPAWRGGSDRCSG